MSLSHSAVEVFCSYAHADEKWLRQLETHLSGLKRQRLISLWHDRQILAGSNWEETIDAHLETASVILLLISADFVASDYCYGVEMKRALERHEANEARVVPIVVRPCDWQQLPFASLQALPIDGKPISTCASVDKGWTQIASELRRIIEDLSLLSASAPRSVLPKIWMLPYPRNPFFLGRDELLTLIRTELQRSQATAFSQPLAFSGLGGIGKTQIAIAIAALLKLPEHNDQEQDRIIQAVKMWLQTHREWLLILDNADDLLQMRAFLPSAFAGHLVLTTRAQAMGRLVRNIKVDTMTQDIGATFLLRRAGLMDQDTSLESTPAVNRTLAREISGDLGGLPLALDQAGAYLEETDCQLSDYLSLYRSRRTDLLKERGGLVPDHPESVATTWSISFQRIEEKNRAAAELLRLCAYLAPDAIPEEIIMEGAKYLGVVLEPVARDPIALNQALAALRAYSLIQRDATKKTLSIHRLVQAVLRDAMDEQRQQKWAERCILAVYAVFPFVEFSNWEQCERCIPHVQACALLVGQKNISILEAAHLLNAAGIYLYNRGRYTEAEPLYQHALRIREQQLGPEHPDVVSPLINLAALYYKQAKVTQAELLYQRALQILERQPGSEYYDDGTTLLYNLAGLYHKQGKYTEAEPLYQRSLQIVEQHLGSEHPHMASALYNLAGLYYKQGKYTEAEPLYQRSLRIKEQQQDPERLDVASLLDNLASLYRQQGKYAEAESSYQRALQIREQLLGSEHLDVASTLDKLAFFYYSLRKYAQAELLYQRSLQIRERQQGTEHPDVIGPLLGLALLYHVSYLLLV